jgi:phage/plasmid-associated DNA primase
MTTNERNFIDELNQSHALVMLGGKCCILNEIINPTFDRPDVTFSSVQDFRNRYANRFTEYQGGKRSPIAEIWLSSAERREYTGIVFSPGEEIPGFFNLWQGFAIEPEQGDWSLMNGHIHQIICNGNDVTYDYMLNWMAYIVQNPGGPKLGVCPVLKGGLGWGKGIFVRSFGLLCGQHFKHITQASQLTGRFNSVLKDALVVFGDEITWGGDVQAAGILKGLITEPTIQIELKGKDIFAIRNHVSLILASNSDWVVPAGLNERRFFILDVSGQRARDHEYFSQIVHQMQNGGLEAMLSDLLQRDLSGVNLREYPRTEALTDQIMRSMSFAQRYWFEHYLQDGNYPDYIQSSTTHQDYLSYARDLGERYPMDARQFGKELRKLCPSIRRRYSTLYGQREWRLYLPDLATARAEFEQVINAPIDWGDTDEDETEDGRPNERGSGGASEELLALM